MSRTPPASIVIRQCQRHLFGLLLLLAAFQSVSAIAAAASIQLSAVSSAQRLMTFDSATVFPSFDLSAWQNSKPDDGMSGSKFTVQEIASTTTVLLDSDLPMIAEAFSNAPQQTSSAASSSGVVESSGGQYADLLPKSSLPIFMVLSWLRHRKRTVIPIGSVSKLFRPPRSG